MNPMTKKKRKAPDATRAFQKKKRVVKPELITSATTLQAPRTTTAEEKFLRDCRGKWEIFFQATGERRALAVVECLTFALIEGGCRP